MQAAALSSTLSAPPIVSSLLRRSLGFLISTALITALMVLMGAA